MRFLKYLLHYRFFRRSEYPTVRALLGACSTYKYESERPIHLTKMRKGEVVESVKLGIWGEDPPMSITLEVGDGE